MIVRLTRLSVTVSASCSDVVGPSLSLTDRVGGGAGPRSWDCRGRGRRRLAGLLSVRVVSVQDRLQITRERVELIRGRPDLELRPVLCLHGDLDVVLNLCGEGLLEGVGGHVWVSAWKKDPAEGLIGVQ